MANTLKDQKISPMPHHDTVKKVADFLVYLQSILKERQYVSMSKELKQAGLSPDYIIVMTNEGVIERVLSGKRGPTHYLWNKEHTPDMETAFKLVMEYNKIRSDQRIIREGNTPRMTNEEHLLEIKQVVLQILKYVKNRKNKGRQIFS